MGDPPEVILIDDDPDLCSHPPNTMAGSAGSLFVSPDRVVMDSKDRPSKMGPELKLKLKPSKRPRPSHHRDHLTREYNVFDFQNDKPFSTGYSSTGLSRIDHKESRVHKLHKARTFHSHGHTSPEYSHLEKGGSQSAMTQPYVDLTANKSISKSTKSTNEETSPYNNQFFNDMATTIVRQFPFKDFARDHNCSAKQVSLAVHTLIVRPLKGQPTLDLGGLNDSRSSGKEETTDQLNTTTAKPDDGNEKRWSWQNPKPIEPVVRRRVWRNEYGNYEPVERGRKEYRRGLK